MPSCPHLALQTPSGPQICPAVQAYVAEHWEHVPALQAYAGSPVKPHAAHSSSVVHALGHLGTQVSPRHRSVVWHAPVSLVVHATHALVIVSQTWCIGSHAMQSALDLHVTVGLPLGSVGQVAPEGTHVPKLEHVVPAGHGFPGSHAMHLPTPVSQIVCPSGQAPQSASPWQSFWMHAVAPLPPVPMPELDVAAVEAVPSLEVDVVGPALEIGPEDVAAPIPEAAVWVPPVVPPPCEVVPPAPCVPVPFWEEPHEETTAMAAKNETRSHPGCFMPTSAVGDA